MSDIRKSIKWADWSSNEVWGCLNKCEYCYARKISFRLAKEFSKIFGIPAEKFQKFEPVWIEKNFQKPIPKYATHIFVNSMSDIAFWQDEWIEKVLEKCKQYPDKKFLFLSKSNTITGRPNNSYCGATITTTENKSKLSVWNMDFLSIEPIQERMDLSKIYQKSIKQIIVGAETGNRKRKVIPKAEWIEEIREFCQKNGIKLFEKDSLKNIVNRPLIQERI